MKKKLLVLGMILVCILGLVACGSDEKELTAEEQQKQEQKKEEDSWIGACKFEVDKYAHDELGWSRTEYEVPSKFIQKDDDMNFYVISKNTKSDGEHYFLFKAIPSNKKDKDASWTIKMLTNYPKDGKFTLEDYKKFD